LLDWPAQVGQQRLELGLFVRLRAVVRRPVLRVGRSLDRLSNRDGLRHDSFSVSILLALNRVADGENVLAGLPCQFMVWAAAMRRFRVGADGVLSAAVALRR